MGHAELRAEPKSHEGAHAQPAAGVLACGASGIVHVRGQAPSQGAKPSPQSPARGHHRRSCSGPRVTSVFKATGRSHSTLLTLTQHAQHVLRAPLPTIQRAQQQGGGRPRAGRQEPFIPLAPPPDPLVSPIFKKFCKKTTVQRNGTYLREKTIKTIAVPLTF